MFRLVRLVILTMFAFVAGVLFQQGASRDVCETEGGNYRDNTCFLEG